MKNKIKHFSALSGAVVVASLLVGCQDFDADHSYSDLSQVVFNQEYADNFIKEYGDLSQVKSWDLSSLGDELNYLGGAMTRANSGEFSDQTPDGTYSFHPIVGDALGNLPDITIGNQTDADYYYLPEATFNWLTENMTEEVDHTDGTKRNVSGKSHTPVPGAGKNFKMSKPTGDFWLLPVYQGKAVSCYDLHLVVNGTDYLVWSKGQGLSYLTKLYRYVGKYHFTKEDGTVGTASKTINSQYKKDFTNPIKVGDLYTAKYTILTDEVTEEAEEQYKHVVTYAINSTNNAKNEVINTSATSLVGEKIEFSYPYFEVAEPVLKSSEWIELSEKTMDKKYSTLEESPYYAWEVRSKPIHFNASKFEGEFYFYLEITRGQWDTNEQRTTSNAAIPGTKQRSDKGMMAAMAANVQSDIAAVTGSSENINALMLGCEAANRGSSDYDYNDVVFLMVSNSPQTIIETEERRYLCEDLGSTYDFDFNDIVVDVKQTQLVATAYDTDKGAWTRSLSDRTQTISIARMCGTIPFQVYIGDDEGNMVNPDFCFEQMTPKGIIEGTKRTNGYTPTSSPADVAKYCKSAKVDEGDNKNKIWWDVTKHNIYINTWPNGTDGESSGKRVMHTARFQTYDPGTIGSADYSPKASNNVPQIIAVDPTVKWMDEKVHIPAAWVNAASTINDIKNETTTNSSTTTE